MSRSGSKKCAGSVVNNINANDYNDDAIKNHAKIIKEINFNCSNLYHGNPSR